MRPILLLPLLLCSLFASAVEAMAVPPPYENLRVVDPTPASGEAVVARAFYTHCVRGEEPIDDQVTVAGNVVTLTVTLEGVICFSPPPPPEDLDYALGSFAPGEYTLVMQVESSIPGIVFSPLTTQFVVGPALHHSIPATSSPMILLLALAMMFAAAWAIRLRAP
jgi:hypothetical protein